jgi:hypothetical protein
VAGNAREAFDFDDSFCRHPGPLIEGLAGDPEAVRELIDATDTLGGRFEDGQHKDLGNVTLP